jgi:hypothetical protein
LLPRPDEILKIGTEGSRRAREAFVRLWLTEGCPQLFDRCPAIWEELRAWLGSFLKTCPKDITVLGSARVGFSLAPLSWGCKFTQASDLDLAIISTVLFKNVVGTYESWVHDYDSGAIAPRNDRERAYWDENRRFGQRNIPLGFYDSTKLPTFDRYPLAQKLGNAMWLLKTKLDRTSDAPKVRYASVRVYGDWACLVARVSSNVREAARKASP